MRTRPGSFYIQDLARAIARLPGRAEVDEEEARRIAEDMAEWYLRGEFRDDEVLVLTGHPPRHRPLAEVVEGAWRDTLPILEWRATVFLTASAVRRYLEGCGYAGAPRVLREWLGDSPKRRKPTADELDEWMRRKVLRPAKRIPTIKACMKETGATWRDALAAFKNLPEELKLKRGQRAIPRKIEQ